MDPIKSDDPQALEKLTARLEQLQALQKHMKACNKVIRSLRGKPEAQVLALQSEGLTEAQARALLVPDFLQRIGYPDYELQNNNGNIRRIQSRIDQLAAYADKESSEESVGKIRIVENMELHRVQLFFPGKPSVGVRSDLKSNGFRWAPSNGAWQAHYSANALRKARRIAESAS